MNATRQTKTFTLSVRSRGPIGVVSQGEVCLGVTYFGAAARGRAP